MVRRTDDHRRVIDVIHTQGDHGLGGLACGVLDLDGVCERVTACFVIVCRCSHAGHSQSDLTAVVDGVVTVFAGGVVSAVAVLEGVADDVNVVTGIHGAQHICQ